MLLEIEVDSQRDPELRRKCVSCLYLPLQTIECLTLFYWSRFDGVFKAQTGPGYFCIIEIWLITCLWSSQVLEMTLVHWLAKNVRNKFQVFRYMMSGLPPFLYVAAASAGSLNIICSFHLKFFFPQFLCLCFSDFHNGFRSF